MKKKESKEIKFTDANKSKQIGFFMRLKRSIFNVEKYGEFILSYFAWISLPNQKEKVEELENMTKRSKKEKEKEKK